MANTRRHLMAVSVSSGIITLIDEQGNIQRYAQRGVHKLNRDQLRQLIVFGDLDKDALYLKELPPNISIYYEDEMIMGKPRASFPGIHKNTSVKKSEFERFCKGM